MIAHSLRAEGFDASEDGTPLVPIAFDCKASGQSGFGVGEIASTLHAMGHANSHHNGGGHAAVAFMPARTFASDGGVDERFAVRDVCDALHTSSGNGNKAPLIAQWAVRRLTPRECERLQGFPDDFTAIPGAADGPRYKALGNSMAVNVMRWLGTRIALVEARYTLDAVKIHNALLAEHEARSLLGKLFTH